MRATLTGLACCMMLGLVEAAPARAQAGAIQLRWTGRAQIQFNTTSVQEEDVAGGGSASIASSTFETRRIRIAARLTIDEWITGMIEPDFAGGDVALKQVWMNLGIDPAFQLRIGHYKKPFSQLLLTSSLDYGTIERGVRIRELGASYEKADADAAGSPVLSMFDGDVVLGEEQELLDLFGYMGYELGAMAHGQLGAFDYSIGVFNGSGADRRDSNDGKSYAGRLRWTAPTELPLALAGAFSYHETRLSAAVPSIDGTAFEVDVEVGSFRREGIHFMGEAVTGESLAVDSDFLAAQGVVSYFRPTGGRVEGIEPAFRVSWGDPNRDRAEDAGVLVTPGINIYFQGRNRLMLNWDAFIPQADRFDARYSLRAQAQLAF